MIEDVIKQRKKERIPIKDIAGMTGYSIYWIYRVESGERRVSKDFIEKYTKAVDYYTELKKKLKMAVDIFKNIPPVV